MTATATEAPATYVNDRHRAAATYAGRGWLVFPVHEIIDGRCACRSAVCGDIGKHPRVLWASQATTDLGVVRSWWQAHPESNIGIVTGAKSGMVVVDVDGLLGEESLSALVAEHGPIPETVEALTGRLDGGRHLYFKHPGRAIPNGKKKLAPGIDVRGDGGFVVAPGSVHLSGNPYQWDGAHHPADLEPAELPTWLRDLITGRPAVQRDQIKSPTGASPPRSASTQGLLPGEDFNLRAKWSEILEPHGWKYEKTVNDEKHNQHWCRPDKPGGTSATISDDGDGVLYVFSTNAEPLEPETGYSKFRAHTILNHGGDFKAAAKALASQGYGEQAGKIRHNGATVPEPDPQPEPLGDAVEFPLLALPEGIRAYINATAAAMNVAPSTVAVACLGALSGAVGATVEIEVKTDWHESAVVWLALVLRPGASKTPVLAEVTRPLHERQARYFEDHRAAMTTFDASGIEAKPTAKRIVASDTTVEKLAVLLGENPRGLLLHRDEMTAFVRSMNQYKGSAGADRSHYLSMWSSSPLLVDRKSSATVHVFRPFVSILAGLQPEMLSELQDRYSRDDGFLDRVLFACPDVPPARWTDETVPHPVRERWRRTILALLSRDLTVTDGRPQPLLRRFSAAGRTAWVEMYNEHCGEMNSRDLSPVLLGPYSKLSAYAARIALLLHEARHVEDGDDATAEVDERTVYAAWSIVDYFKTQQRHVFGLLAQSPEDRRLVAIHRWLVRQGGETTLRALVRANVAGIGNAEQAREAANRLVARGWVEQADLRNEHGPSSVTLRVVREGLDNVG